METMPTSPEGTAATSAMPSVFPDENAAFGESSRPVRLRLQPRQDALAHLANMVGPRAQIGVLPPIEHLHVLGDNMSPGADRPASAADALNGLRYQLIVAEQHDVHLEEGAHVLAEIRSEALDGCTQLASDSVDRDPERLLFRDDVLYMAIRNGVELGAPSDQGHGTDGETRRRGHALHERARIDLAA
jgi:hypothetical protein